jgi:hypothetical protein
MKIKIGSIFSLFTNEPVYALEIPGIGILEAEGFADEFRYVELNEDQLLTLINEAVKSLLHIKRKEMEDEEKKPADIQ